MSPSTLLGQLLLVQGGLLLSLLLRLHLGLLLALLLLVLGLLQLLLMLLLHHGLRCFLLRQYLGLSGRHAGTLIHDALGMGLLMHGHGRHRGCASRRGHTGRLGGGRLAGWGHGLLHGGLPGADAMAGREHCRSGGCSYPGGHGCLRHGMARRTVFVDVGDSDILRVLIVLHHGAHRARLGDIGLVVVDHGRPGHGRGWRHAWAPVMPLGCTPVHIPGMPTPGRMGHAGLRQQHACAKAQQACGDGDADAYCDRRRDVVIASVDRQRFAIDNAGIILGHIDGADFGGGNFDVLLRRRDHRLWNGGNSVAGHVITVAGSTDGTDDQMFGAFERARLVCAVAHDLYGIEHISRVVVIGLAQRGGPGQVGGQLLQHIGKLGQRFDGRVPVLGVDRIAHGSLLQAGVLA